MIISKNKGLSFRNSALYFDNNPVKTYTKDIVHFTLYSDQPSIQPDKFNVFLCEFNFDAGVIVKTFLCGVTMCITFSQYHRIIKPSAVLKNLDDFCKKSDDEYLRTVNVYSPEFSAHLQKLTFVEIQHDGECMFDTTKIVVAFPMVRDISRYTSAGGSYRVYVTCLPLKWCNHDLVKLFGFVEIKQITQWNVLVGYCSCTVEFNNEEDMQRALELHETHVLGRKIFVSVARGKDGKKEEEEVVEGLAEEVKQESTEAENAEETEPVVVNASAELTSWVELDAADRENMSAAGETEIPTVAEFENEEIVPTLNETTNPELAATATCADVEKQSSIDTTRSVVDSQSDYKQQAGENDWLETLRNLSRKGNEDENNQFTTEDLRAREHSYVSSNSAPMEGIVTLIVYGLIDCKEVKDFLYPMKPVSIRSKDLYSFVDVDSRDCERALRRNNSKFDGKIIRIGMAKVSNPIRSIEKMHDEWEAGHYDVQSSEETFQSDSAKVERESSETPLTSPEGDAKEKEYIEPENERTEPEKENIPTEDYKVYVSYICKMTRQDIDRLFAPLKNFGYAFVRFYDKESAEKAIEKDRTPVPQGGYYAVKRCIEKTQRKYTKFEPPAPKSFRIEATGFQKFLNHSAIKTYFGDGVDSFMTKEREEDFLCTCTFKSKEKYLEALSMDKSIFHGSYVSVKSLD